ncbi:hypothetical protein cypCar_00021178 [Cyprinus carpio]|nr:hypothetical protein cypCar_00021178 [Cyprinus carpio]
MADSGRVKHDSPSSSPGPGRKKAQQSPGSKARYSVNAPGHCFRKVTLTKPTFCHHCSDFIWGIVGFVCEVRGAQPDQRDHFLSLTSMKTNKCISEVQSVLRANVGSDSNVNRAHSDPAVTNHEDN